MNENRLYFAGFRYFALSNDQKSAKQRTPCMITSTINFLESHFFRNLTVQMLRLSVEKVGGVKWKSNIVVHQCKSNIP